MGKPKKSKTTSETKEQPYLKQSTPPRKSEIEQRKGESDCDQIVKTALSEKSKSKSIFRTSSSFDSGMTVGAIDETASVLLSDFENKSYE